MVASIARNGPRRGYALMLVCIAGAGCAHLGTPVNRISLPPGAPEVKSILADLAANDAALRNFESLGTFTLVTPERPGVERFRRSSILFRKPADLHIVGRRGPLSTTVFELTCVGREFLIEFRTEQQYYWNVEGEQFENVPFSVSPSDVAREMFLPEPWADLPPKQVRMTAYDEAAQTATLELLEPGAKHWVRRRVTVTGLPWVVARSERLDEQGRVLATVTKSDYREQDGIRFPVVVDADFPTESTRMTFDMGTIKLNTELDETKFDIAAIHERVKRLGQTQVEYEHGAR